MCTNCAPLVADLFLFCYERDLIMSLSGDEQAGVIDAFNTTSKYLDDILNINNVYFNNMVSQINPSELQLNKANTSDTEAAFMTCIKFCQFQMILFLPKFMINVTTLILKLSISHFLMVMFLALYAMESISLNSFVLLDHLAMLLTSTLAINCKLRNFFKQGYRYHKLRKTFSKFYRRYYDLISKFQVGLKSLLCQGLRNLNSMVTWCLKLKNIVGSNNFYNAVTHCMLGGQPNHGWQLCFPL